MTSTTPQSTPTYSSCRHSAGWLCVLFILTLALCVANLFWGSLRIPASDVWNILCGESIPDHPSWSLILLQNRLPQMLTALLSGAALSCSGLMLQTLFRNPLAGPSILGIDAGANLGVALVMLFLGGSISLGSLSMGGYSLVIVAALIGALGIMALLLGLSSLLRDPLMLLITGVIVSYVSGSLISLLNFNATSQGVRSFVLWGMGNLGGVTLQHLPLFGGLCIAGLLMATLYIKPLDALLLGDRYAANLGVPIRRTRGSLLFCTGLLTATTTAFCGPISFLGLAVPHLTRLTLRSGTHRTLLPGTLLMGSSLMLLCNLISVLPSDGNVIPINVITPLIGAPVILYILIHNSSSIRN